MIGALAVARRRENIPKYETTLARREWQAISSTQRHAAGSGLVFSSTLLTLSFGRVVTIPDAQAIISYILTLSSCQLYGHRKKLRFQARLQSRSESHHRMLREIQISRQCSEVKQSKKYASLHNL